MADPSDTANPDESVPPPLPGIFWTTLAASADPPTQQALLAADRTARDSVLQCAPSTTLTLPLSGAHSPETLALLRTSGRLLPASVAIDHDSNCSFTLAAATNAARLLLPHLTCPAITSLTLSATSGDYAADPRNPDHADRWVQTGGDHADRWLATTGLLASIHQSLPGLRKLDLHRLGTPPHPHAYHTPANLHLTSLSIQTLLSDLIPDTDDEESVAAVAVTMGNLTGLLTALGLRAGGSVTDLTWRTILPYFDARGSDLTTLIGSVLARVLTPMLWGDQLTALRKLSIPGYFLGDVNVMSNQATVLADALIHRAPALEHLCVKGVNLVRMDAFGTAYVPWRILEVEELDPAGWRNLPLGTRLDQPNQPNHPLIIRVTRRIIADSPAEASTAGVAHLTTQARGRRAVRLECTRTAYASLANMRFGRGSSLAAILRLLTLTADGLSNLILDGIHTKADLEGLVDIRTTGIVVSSFCTDRGRSVVDVGQLSSGLAGLPHVFRLELRMQVSPPRTLEDDERAWEQQGLQEPLRVALRAQRRPTPTMAQARHAAWREVNVVTLGASLPPSVTYLRLSDGPAVETVWQLCIALSRVPHRQERPLQLSVPGVEWGGAAVAQMVGEAGLGKAGYVAVD